MQNGGWRRPAKRGRGLRIGVDYHDEGDPAHQVLFDLGAHIGLLVIRQRTSTARSAGPFQNPRGSDSGIRSCRMKAMSGARTVSGFDASLNPTSVITTPNFRGCTC